MSATALTLLEKLDKWSRETPLKVAMSFLDESGDVVKGSSMTYSDINVKSTNLAAHLMSAKYNLNVGDRCVMWQMVDSLFMLKNVPSHNVPIMLLTPSLSPSLSLSFNLFFLFHYLFHFLFISTFLFLFLILFLFLFLFVGFCSSTLLHWTL